MPKFRGQTSILELIGKLCGYQIKRQIRRVYLRFVVAVATVVSVAALVLIVVAGHEIFASGQLHFFSAVTIVLGYAQVVLILLNVNTC